ncbi:hypothetical protein ACQ4M3_38660 [Leptolyngbya sp. AN03gr2]
MFTINPLIPQPIDGSDKLDNLALACRCCNEPTIFSAKV